MAKTYTKHPRLPPDRRCSSDYMYCETVTALEAIRAAVARCITAYPDTTPGLKTIMEPVSRLTAVTKCWDNTRREAPP